MELNPVQPPDSRRCYTEKLTQRGLISFVVHDTYKKNFKYTKNVGIVQWIPMCLPPGSQIRFKCKVLKFPAKEMCSVSLYLVRTKGNGMSFPQPCCSAGRGCHSSATPPQSTQDGCGVPATHPRYEAGSPITVLRMSQPLEAMWSILEQKMFQETKDSNVCAEFLTIWNPGSSSIHEKQRSLLGKHFRRTKKDPHESSWKLQGIMQL